jgi:hypothetical protein
MSSSVHPAMTDSLAAALAAGIDPVRAVVSGWAAIARTDSAGGAGIGHAGASIRRVTANCA